MVSMCNCSARCMIARRVSKPNISRLHILHFLCQHGCEPENSCSQGFLVFACTWKCGRRSRCTHTMRMRTCVPVVVCIARKLRLCPSYGGRRDRDNSVHWRSLYKGGGGGYFQDLLACTYGADLDHASHTVQCVTMCLLRNVALCLQRNVTVCRLHCVIASQPHIMIECVQHNVTECLVPCVIACLPHSVIKRCRTLFH